MISKKRNSYNRILESNDGIHLTIYLENRENLKDLRSQLEESLNEAREYLSPVLSTEDKKNLLSPVEALLKENRIIRNINGNIGIFRTNDFFRILNIPIPLERQCHVANSFHVKPLLRWLQGHQDFLFIGIQNNFVSLYLGSERSLKMIDSIFFLKSQKMREGSVVAESAETLYSSPLIAAEIFSWLNDKISELTIADRPKLFVAGDPSLISDLKRHLNYRNIFSKPVAHSFKKEDLGLICQSIREVLRTESQKAIEKSLLEFRFAEEENRVKKNIFQISKAVIQGKVRKLIVTDELNIFGKIDLKSGGLAIHPIDLDHEDDCILDDLAQMVLNQGGEVVVAKRDEIPKGRPVLAILDESCEIEMELHERSGEFLREKTL